MKRISAEIDEIIEQGQITVGGKQEIRPYIIKVLGTEDLKEVMRLQNLVIGSLEKKEYYVPIPEEELRFILEGGGESVGLFIRDRLYAACSLLFDVAYENNMAREIGFSEEELGQVVQFELSMVNPELRGHRLQYKLAGILARRLEERGTARYLFTTVSPYNYASVQTVTSLGLLIAGLSKMYFDWNRYVVYKDLYNPVKLDTANAVSLANTALIDQQQLLHNGYRGFAQCKDENGTKILYAKIL